MEAVDQLEDLIKIDQIEQYVRVVFGGAPEDGSLAINMRLIGEKGTPAEGKPPRNLFATYEGVEQATDWIYGEALQAAKEQRGVFVMPGFLEHHAVTEKSASVRFIKSFKTVCIDIDSGDIESAVGSIMKDMGKLATLEVLSGGVTEDGQPKVHLYFELSELSDKWFEIAELREALALKYGGDPAFKRATQVIRVPGTAHQKNSQVSTCQISLADSTAVYDLEDLLLRFPLVKGPKQSPTTPAASGINAFAGAGKGDGIGDATTTDIHEGGTDTENRWSVFSQVAGHYVHQARVGALTIQDARNFAHGWMIAHMKPAWPDERFDREWGKLVAADVSEKGAFEKHQASQEAQPAAQEALPESILSDWQIGRYTTEKPRPRKWLVSGLVLSGKRQMLAAAGGAGKSYAMLNLGLVIAAANNAQPGDPNFEWFGHQVDRSNAGAVIILSCEDDKEEIARRLHELDPDGGLRERAAEDLIVIPTDNVGGSFPLVSYDRRGNASYSKQWLAFLEAVNALHESGKRVALVVIDTLNAVLHGDENSAQVASEFISAVSPVTAQIGAALMVTHHARKGSGDGDMTGDMVRGSNALTNAMRNVLGIYPCPDFEEIMPLIGRAPKENELFELSVLKGNVAELERNKKYLVRSSVGFLVDVSDEVETARTVQAAQQVSSEDERKAWLLFAIDWAARQGVPYSMTGENGIAARATSLSKKVTGGNTSPSVLLGMVRELREKGLIVGVPQVYDKATESAARGRIDVRGGVLETKAVTEIDTGKAFQPPDYSKFAYDIPTRTIKPASSVGIGDRLIQNMTDKKNAETQKK